MALHGNLRDFSATEILQLLASQKKSGCLFLEADDRPTEVFYVADGRLVSTRHPGMHEPDRLMELLLRANRLSDEQCQGVRTIQRASGRDLEDRSFHIRLEEEGFDLVAGVNPIPVPATSSLETRVFVIADADRPHARSTPLRFVLEREDPGHRPVMRDSRFLAPEAGHGS